MATRIRALNMLDFTGGLNLRADAFALAENESPDMLNIEVDPRGGFRARQGWQAWPVSPGGDWDPRTLFVHELSNGAERVYLAGGARINYTDDLGNTWTKLQASGTDVVAEAAPHDADFAVWGDTLYMACGINRQSVRVVGSTATRMTQAESGTWTEYVSPSSGRMPHAELMASHAGYLFVGSTEEGGTLYPNRVRWSHPNNPEAWQQDDYIDIGEAGGPLTALVPMRDHLLIFKRSSVWALYGESADSWQVVNVAREVGAVSRQAVARSESAVFFFVAGEGVYMIADGERPQEISEQLRPAFGSAQYDAASEAEFTWLGWVGQRLWCNLRYSTTDNSTETVFVWDPTLTNRGSWTAFLGGDNTGLGPFAQGGHAGGGRIKAGCAHASNVVMSVEARATADDDDGFDPLPFQAYYRTAWVHADSPTLKKSWRRPDLVVKEESAGYQLTINSYRDYDESNLARSGVLNVAAAGTAPTWGSFVWGDGSIYGAGAVGSRIERGSSLGSARAVQLLVSSPNAVRWGVDAIIHKFIPRRMR